MFKEKGRSFWIWVHGSMLNFLLDTKIPLSKCSLFLAEEVEPSGTEIRLKLKSSNDIPELRAMLENYFKTSE